MKLILGHKQKHLLSSKLSHLRSGSFIAAAFLICLGGYSVLETNAHSGGITGETQKTTNEGCHCHCTSSNSATTVSISTSDTVFYTGQTYEFTAAVSNSSESDGGIDISTEFGSLSAISGQGLYIPASSTELTHSSPKSLPASWNFDWTAPSTPEYDTIFATGNAVNGDGSNGGGNCTDKWNWASKYIIHVVAAPTKRIALSRSSISLGQIRVGRRVADSLMARSTGSGAITISSSGMKSGAQFSSYPTSSNRTLNPGSSEVDSAIFSPTARGSFNDSLIFTTNSDTTPQQHIGVYITGQGIQGVFNATNGTNLAFGNLRAGRTAQMTFSYSNSGDDTLFLLADSISGTAFSIVSGGSAINIPPNQSGSVVVQFAPAAKQAYSGTLFMRASGGVSAPSVSLSGNGTLPAIQVLNHQDLGQVRVGLSQTGTVTFQNIGNDTLHLSNAHITQPGSLFALQSYDQTIVPSATGSVRIGYQPDSERTDSATLHFTTDDPTDSSVSVVLTGSGVLPHMVVSQNHDTIDLGQVKVNSSSTAPVSVTNNGGAVLSITSSIPAGSPPFSILSSPPIVGANSVADVTVQFSPTATGTFSGMLVIQGDDSKNPLDTVYLTGTGINSALTIRPANVAFGPVPVASTATDTVWLINTGAATLSISRYHLSAGGFAILDSTAHQVAAADSAKLIVSFHPDTAGSYSGTLTLTTDDANTPTRTINLTGTGVKGALTVLPSSLDFGTLLIGHDSTIQLSLRNSGQANISISSVTFTGPGASVFSDNSFTTPATITAGDSTKLSVTFMPAAVQTYQGMIRFVLGDGTNVTIPIQGAGAQPAGVGPDMQSHPLALTISPNPASNEIAILATLSASSVAELHIFDAAGREVLQRSLGSLSSGSHELQLPVASLPSGSYFVRLQMADGSSVETSLQLQR